MNKDEIIINCETMTPDEQCMLKDGLGWIGCHYKDVDGDKNTSQDYTFYFLDKLDDKARRSMNVLLYNIFSNRKCEFRQSDKQLYLSSRE